MAVETNTPYRRVVGTLIRGVGDGLLGTPSGIPLAGAKVIAEASIRSATSDHYIAFDPVEGITDNNAVLRNAITGEPGLLLVVTDDPSVGVVDWTWHITITAPTLARPIEFDLPVPTGSGDLDLSTMDPVPGSGGEVVYVWREAITAEVTEKVDEILADADVIRGNSRRLAQLGVPDDDSFWLRDGDGNYSVYSGPDGISRIVDIVTRRLLIGGVYLTEGSPNHMQMRDGDNNVSFDANERGEVITRDLHVRRVTDSFGRVITGPGMYDRVVLLDMWGQSNGLGRGMPFGIRLDPAHQRLMQAIWYGPTVFGLGVATVPISAQVTGTGYSSLTKVGRLTLQEYDERTLVVVLNSAVGDTGVLADTTNGNWRVDYAGSNPKLYDIALAALDKTISLIVAAYGVQPDVRLFWNQGEADTGSSPAAYSTAVQAIFAGVRAHLGKPDLPIVAAGMVPEYRTAGGQAIVDELAKLESTLLNYVFVDGVPNGGGSQSETDTVHYTRQALEDLGEQQHGAWKRAVVSTVGTVPQKPLRVTATRAGSQVTARWSTPLCRVTSYLLEYRSDGGAWQAVTRSVGTRPFETFTASGVVDVRVSTTNDVGTSRPTIPTTAIGA